MNTKQFWNDLKSGQFVSMVKESSKGRPLYEPMHVFNVMKPVFAEKADIERFFGIFMNSRNEVLAIEGLFDGTINHAMVYPREIIKQVISLKATAVVLVHNHISGDPKPSRDDERVTMKIGLSLLSVDVKLHDHIIVGEEYHSMAESGYIQKVHDRLKDIFVA